MGRPWGWGELEEEEAWRRGPWTAAEDRLLIEYVTLHGEGRWNSVASSVGLKRSGKSCRLRWVNYLRPDLKKGQITPHEERLILELHAQWGNRWSTIARSLPGRTDNEIKNYWRTHFKKKSKLSECSEKQKSRILKEQRQQHTVAGLKDGENQISEAPEKLQEMVWIDPIREEQFFPSMFTVDSLLPETSWEESLWGDLWNFDDMSIMDHTVVHNIKATHDGNI